MMKEINNMNIHIVPPEFCIQEINPFTNQVYDKNWVYIEVNDENEYQMFDKTEHGLFQTYLSRNSLGWQWRLMDFIGYELNYHKHIIINIDSDEYQCIEQTYKGHSYMDCYLREYENSVLVHSTPKDNYENIKRTGVLKSWNLLKKNNEINENNPIGDALGDHEEYRDYIMFSNGGVSGEIVVNSKNHNKIVMDIDSEYVPGARLYFNAKKIAESGLLVRDGLHYKVKDKLPLGEYLLWVSTIDDVDLKDKVCSPINFAKASDCKFQKLYKGYSR